MESSRFDDLTKVLATATSRRQALKTIAATTLGSILGLAGIGTAFAKCHNASHNCDENSTCCSKLCCNGKCCASGQGCCNGTCTDLNTTSNCGSCGNKCDACSTCHNGTCVSSCDASQCQTCQGGTCASSCTPSQVCQSGRCCLPSGAVVNCCTGCGGEECCSVRIECNGTCDCTCL